MNNKLLIVMFASHRADKYVFTLNSNIRAYICIELQRVSENKYYYYIGSGLYTYYTLLSLLKYIVDTDQ